MIGGVIAAGAGFAIPRSASTDPTPVAPFPTRPFGKTGRTVTTFGLGCYYVGAAASDEDGVAVVRKALDLGCTYFDTAPSYVHGVSERRVGLGLEKRRDGVFLSTKTLERQGQAARRELEDSLKRLKTDHVDMIQVHCVRDAEDLDEVLSDRGPLPALAKAREQGLVRFIGVTIHTHPELVKTALSKWTWDSVLMPLNPVDLHWQSFVTDALPVAVKAGLARVAMKVFASGRIVQGDHALSAEECLRFAYGLDVSCAVVGCATPAEVELAARVAADGKALEDDRRTALIAAAKPFSGKTDGGVEWYKASPPQR
jgi:aryl-alcohol dehydrogenase-like predicted oxidoreductase